MAIKSQDNIEPKIFTIRDTQVILDKDLAAFYEVKSIRLREQVKRNPNRFPSDFVFQLSDKEVDLLVSQNAIPSKQSLGGYLPYLFSEWDRLQSQIATTKDLGKKWFAFSRMDSMVDDVLDKLNFTR